MFSGMLVALTFVLQADRKDELDYYNSRDG